MNQGTDFSLVIGIFNVSGAVDITGYQFLGQMRQSTDPAVDSPIAEFVFSILNQTTNTGQVQWTLSEAAIDAVVTSIATSLEPNRLTTPFIFDIKMKDTSGNISRIIQGLIEVSPQATMEEFS